MDRMTLTEDDRGKPVRTTDGTEMGRLIEIRGGRGFVDPDPSLVDTIKAKLGWGGASAGARPIDETDVERITEDAVYLMRSA